MLKLVQNERVIMVDIDDTLVMHGQVNLAKSEDELVNILDPIKRDTFITMRVNLPMVRLVQEEIARGSKVCFWSRGGFLWAYNVLLALKLDQLPGEQIVMTKPFAYFDDSPVDKWLVDRVYLGPDVPYKK